MSKSINLQRGTMKSLLSILAVVSVSATSLVSALPAHAAPTVSPSVVPQASAKSITLKLQAPKTTNVYTSGFHLSWTPTKNAHHYQIQISKTPDFKNAQIQDRYVSRSSGELSQNTTYYSRYRVVFRAKSIDTISNWSPTLKVKTKPRYPTEFKTTAKRTAQGVTLSWTKSAYATKYRVLYADNKTMDRNVRTYWTTKQTMNVPMNNRDGQPHYVRVFSYNGPHMRWNDRLEVKPASPQVAKGEDVRVASQNIMCYSCAAPGNQKISWSTRSSRLFSQITTDKSDVLLLQEAFNPKLGTKKGVLTPFLTSLSKKGYSFDSKIANTNSDANKVAFNNKKYKLVERGRFAIIGERRTAVWVQLESKKTKKRFYAVSTHPSPYVSVSQRLKSAQDVMTKMEKINKKKLPIYVGGDMNSSPFDTKGTTHTYFMRNGWTDAASASEVKNQQFTTYNALGTRKIEANYSRIDYIYSKYTGGWKSYTNVIRVSSKGKLLGTYGSDHNYIVGVSTLK